MMADEPAVILGNPPYADLGLSPQSGALVEPLKTMRVNPRPTAEMCVGFVEQMTRLASRKQFSGSLVLPLSVAYSISPQFIAVRQLIQATAGHWRFAFFNREPQALFGEDVKTRNAIIFWHRDQFAKEPIISSGPLRRWRNRERSALFDDIGFTDVSCDIQGGIPKLDGAEQVAAFETLNGRWHHLELAVLNIGRATLEETLTADDCSVFVGNTAYNFLNVFLRPPKAVLDFDAQLSENPLHAIRCGTPEDALAVFGTLTSRLAYWWWHTHGDGFHVSRRFLAEFPYGVDILGDRLENSLAASGSALWSAIRTNPTISLNRGRTSLGYNPNRCGLIRGASDAALVTAAGLDRDFTAELERFTDQMVTFNL